MSSESNSSQERKIGEAFFTGLSRAYGRVFFRWIDENVLRQLPNSAAKSKALGLTPGNYSKGKSSGELSINGLLRCVLALKKDWHDLPKLPQLEVLVLSGYLDGIKKAIDADSSLASPKAILQELTIEDICCLYGYTRHHQNWLRKTRITSSELADKIFTTALEIYKPFRDNLPEDSLVKRKMELAGPNRIEVLNKLVDTVFDYYRMCFFSIETCPVISDFGQANG